MWLNQLKIAIIEEDVDKMQELFKSMPQFETIEEMKSAQALIKEATNLLHTLQDEVAAKMRQLKKNIKYLEVTQEKKPSGFDITS